MRTSTLPLFMLLAVLFMYGCKGSSATATESRPAIYDQLDANLQKMADDWKADAYGCNKVRVANNAEVLAKMCIEARLSEKDVAGLLGNIEMSTMDGGRKKIGYYFDGECSGGKWKEGAVGCLLRLFLNSDTGLVESGGVICG